MASAAGAYQAPAATAPAAGGAYPNLGLGMSMGAAAMETEVVDIAQQVVGKIIGKAGSTISSIQDRSGSKIQIDQSMPDGQPRKVSISGTPQAIAAAKQVSNMRLPSIVPSIVPSIDAYLQRLSTYPLIYL